MICIYCFHPGSITMWSPAVHFGRKPSSCRLSLYLRRNWVICRRSSAMKFKAMCSPLTNDKIQLILDHAFGKIYFFSCYVSLHVTMLWWRILWIINTYKYCCFITGVAQCVKKTLWTPEGRVCVKNIWRGHSVD